MLMTQEKETTASYAWLPRRQEGTEAGPRGGWFQREGLLPVVLEDRKKAGVLAKQVFTFGAQQNGDVVT